jgi:hypothetical protein
MLVIGDYSLGKAIICGFKFVILYYRQEKLGNNYNRPKLS